ncbi:MAG TPA: FAD-dependent oxidoreductase [Pyrinomonadaceae bacterium]|nr:FAD-dependent oxidoreductase [Pyrinomonadaceae bacterium]
MDCEVAVVGGGIGGLTVAALLAQRGVDVCLFERESQVGGCAVNFEKFDHTFEQGYGLYSSWQRHDIHDRIFSELPVSPPETRVLEPGLVIRLPDHSEVEFTNNIARFEEDLSRSFPECSAEAIEFYRQLLAAATALRRALADAPDLLTATGSKPANSEYRHEPAASDILSSLPRTISEKMAGVSSRFRGFVDVQLQAMLNATSSIVAYPYAALALTAPLEGMFGIRSGSGALANRLADSIKASGGRIRLDTPVLRMSYSSAGEAQGLDLLSGETVLASRAIVSNLTLWDTYGKLIGINRAPLEVRQQLKSLQSWGAYLLYLSMDQDAAERLKASHILNLTEWPAGKEYDPEANHLMFAAAPAWDPRAPSGKRAVTVHNFTAADEWFSFHTDEAELEARDQEMLERCWRRLHLAMPELGSSIEVLDTATPRTFYETTRRRLGMVGSPPEASSPGLGLWQAYSTPLANTYLISDTASPGGLAGLSYAALALANYLTHR